MHFRRVRAFPVAGVILAAISLSLSVPTDAGAYVTYGCRQPFVDVSGTRYIKIYYIDAANYTTLSPLSAGRWNAAMGPPQAMTLDSVNYTLYSSELIFGATGYDGITQLPTCNGSGFWSSTTYGYGNRTYLEGASSGYRFSVMVHEYGHALGLDHNNAHGNCTVVQVMYATSDRFVNCGVEAPKSDDVAGVNSIY